MDKKRIAIIGAGFSGTMLANHLVNYSPYPLAITLLDMSGKFGEGVAYGTTNPHHLLNVRAERMSAYPDQPNHFVEWLQAHGYTELGAKSFAPRMIYGAYLKDQLAQLLQMARDKGHEVQCLPYGVRDIHIEDNQCHIQCDKAEILAECAILAVGSLPPKDFTYEKKLFHAPHRFVRNVWNPSRQSILHLDKMVPNSTDSIAIIGTGLTMVDTILSLRDKGFTGKIVTFSRHGHLPHVHQSTTPYPHTWDIESLPNTALELLMWVRAEIRKAEAEGYHWQAVIDSVRPVTNPLWNRLPIREKRRFLRHLFSLWNIHRHRMPPESALILAAMQSSGQLHHLKGSIMDADSDEDALVISYHQKYTPGIQTMRASCLLNCTGAEVDIGKLSSQDLLYCLRETGYVTVGTLRAGLEQQQGHLKGTAADYLFALGPVFFGNLLETTAVPELRVQSKELALHLLRFLKEKSTNNFTI
jgi:uncharacterized NAD(P)/FAD-binding protein YdhS